MHKNTIIKKTMQVSRFTLLSRLLGIAREVLMANYLGAGPIAEAFITAFKLPNFLRKIFAGGALSTSFVPTFIKIVKSGEQNQINRLTSRSLLLFTGIFSVFCLFVFWKPHFILRCTAPGWFAVENYQPTPSLLSERIYFLYLLLFFGTPINHKSIAYASTFLRLLISLALILSSSALFASVFQAVHHFFVPAFSPLLLNGIFILGILICVHYKYSPIYLCFFIILGALVQLALHGFLYWKLGFRFQKANQKTFDYFKAIWYKFFPCLFSMSTIEIYVFIATSLSSYLSTGSIALIYYAHRFMQVPLDVIATAFSTILLPHFSRLSVHAPRRLSFYLFEATKFIVWCMLPITLYIFWSAEKIFLTLFLSHKFTIEHVHEAALLLQAFLYGLLFYALNKILFSIFYAFDEILIPMFIAIVCIIVNFVMSYALLHILGAYGIALATTCSGITQTVLSIIFLQSRYNFVFYWQRFSLFLIRTCIQVAISFTIFMYTHDIIEQWLFMYYPLLTNTIAFWLWATPLALLFGIILYKTRKLFGITLVLLD